MELFHNIEFWVAISFVLFVALTYPPIARFATRALDDRSARIASELQEAQKLRLEAEQILADYKRRQAEISRETAAILDKTRQDAKQIAAFARAGLEGKIEKHTSAAQEKIAQAEAKALKDVRDHMVDIAIGAARAIMRDYLAKGGSHELLAAAASEIERKLH